MRWLRMMALAIGAVAAFAALSQPVMALENCYVVRATADARNPQVSTERSRRRLQKHIAQQVTTTMGQHVGPVQTQCIRNACESSAIICSH